MNSHEKIERCLNGFDGERIPSSIPVALPLIEQFRREHPGKEPFRNVDVLFIQHQLGPFIPKLEAMVSEGLDRKRCWFVDIPYSTSALVSRELREKGCRTDQMTGRFSEPLEDYDESQSIRITYLRRERAAARGGR